MDESRHKPHPKPSPSPQPVPPGQVAVGPRPPNCFWSVTIAEINAGQVKHTYVQITGTIEQAHNETDGDVHLHVLDSSVPAKGAQGGRETIMCHGLAITAGSLVCEIVPESPLPAPAVGAKVTIAGTLRFDLEHNWPEIHPIASIT